MAVRSRWAAHTASVLCVAPVQDTQLLISGGEDGAVVVSDVRLQKAVQRLQVSHDEAVPSVVPQPAENALQIWCSAGSRLYRLDIRQLVIL